MEGYNRRLLQIAAAQLCQQLGWQGIQATAMEMLNDILERYLLSLGRTLHAYSEQFGRTYPEIPDLELTFQDLGINLSELGDYLNQVDFVPFPHKLPAVPQPRPPDLHFPKCNSRELAEREEHVFDYLPPMHPEWEEEMMTPLRGPEAMPVSEDGAPILLSPTATGEKRSMSQSSDMTPPNKRLRLLPDEAGHSMYEMKSVVMSNGGQPTPTRGQGRLPEACTPPPSTPITPLPTLPLTPLMKPKMLGSPSAGVIAETVEERIVLERLDGLEEFKPNMEAVEGGPYLHSPPKHMAPPTIAKPSPRPGKKSKAKTPKGKSVGLKSPKGGKTPAPGKSPKVEISAASPVLPVNLPGLPPPSPAARQLGERLGLDIADTESPEPKLVIAEDEARLREADEQRQARLRSYEDTIEEVIAQVCSPSDRREDGEPSRETQMATVGRSAKERPLERPSVTAFLKKAAEIKAELEEDEETREKRRQMEVQLELEKIRQKTKEWERQERERLEREARIEDTIEDVIRKVTQDPSAVGSGDESRLSDMEALGVEPLVEEVVEEAIIEEIIPKPPTPGPDVPMDLPPASPAMSFSPPPTPGGIGGTAPSKDIYTFDDDDDDDEFSVDIPEIPDSPPAVVMDEMRVRTKASYKMKAIDMPPLDGADRKLKGKAQSPAERSGSYDFPGSYKSPSGSPSTVTTDSPIPPLSLKVDKTGKYLRVSKDDREHKREKKKKKNKDRDKDRDRKDKDKKDRDRKDRKDKDRKKDKKKEERKKEEPTVPKLTFKFGASEMGVSSQSLSVSIPGLASERDALESKTPSKVSPKLVEEMKPAPVSKPQEPPPKPPPAPRPMTPSPPSSPSPQASPTHIPARLPTPPPPSSIPPPPPSSGRGRKGGKAKGSPQKTTPPPPKPPPTKAALKAPPPPKAPKGRPSKKSPKVAAAVPAEPKVVEEPSDQDSTAAEEASQLRTVIAETVGTIVDENGETIWICPACKMQDDGSPMIGCDECDDWYHWVCVGIKVDPNEDEWFCPRCNAKRIEKDKKSGRGPRRKRKKKP